MDSQHEQGPADLTSRVAGVAVPGPCRDAEAAVCGGTYSAQGPLSPETSEAWCLGLGRPQRSETFPLQALLNLQPQAGSPCTTSRAHAA